MNNFKEIKQQWVTRKIVAPSENNFREIIKKSGQLRKKQRTSQVILGITVLILLLFFFYISAYKNVQTFWGLGIMTGSLVVRIIVEYFSALNKKRLPMYDNMKNYHQKLTVYYQGRKYIHYLLTPFLFGVYIVGFLLLLPAFKSNLSRGFYTYIIISSILVFIFLAVLIGTQIKKELRIIQQLLRYEN